MHIIIRRLLPGFALLAALAAQPVLADPVFPPGLRIGLEPPPGLTLSRTIPGFQDSEREASITILDLPARLYNEIEKQVFSTELQRPGVTIDKRESFPFRDGMGFLVTAKIQAPDRVLHRWFFIAAAPVNPAMDLATLVTVEVPEAALTQYSDAVVRTALASISFRPEPVDEMVALLPFKVTDLAGFQVARVFGRAGLLLTAGAPEADPLQPHVFVSVGPGAPQEREDRGTFAQRLLAGAPVRDLRVTSANALRLGNQAGYEIRAEGKDATGANTLSLVQWVRFGSQGFLRIVGVARQSDWEAMYPRFRAIRDGVDTR